MRRVHVRQTYRDPHRRERTGRRLRPLDETDRVLEVRLEVAPLRRRETLEAEEVEVRDVRVARVAVTDSEGRAGDRAGHAERTAGAADEGRLAAAELARDGDDVAYGELARQLRGECLGVFGRCRPKLGQNSPSWTAGSVSTAASCGASTGASSLRPSKSGRQAKSSSSTFSIAGVYSAAAGW